MNTFLQTHGHYIISNFERFVACSSIGFLLNLLSFMPARCFYFVASCDENFENDTESDARDEDVFVVNISVCLQTEMEANCMNLKCFMNIIFRGRMFLFSLCIGT